MSSSGKLVPDAPLAPPLAAILSDGSQLMERGDCRVARPPSFTYLHPPPVQPPPRRFGRYGNAEAVNGRQGPPSSDDDVLACRRPRRWPDDNSLSSPDSFDAPRARCIFFFLFFPSVVVFSLKIIISQGKKREGRNIKKEKKRSANGVLTEGDWGG